MKRIALFLFVLVIIVNIVCYVSAAQREATVIVDLSKGTGQLPFLFRAGFFNGNIIPHDYFVDKFLHDLKPGAVELYLAHTTIRPSTSLQDLDKRLSEWDSLARRVTEKGGEIVVEIAAMPNWLSSTKSQKPVNPAIGDDTPIGALSPPKDYNEWAKMVECIVDHFNNKLKVKARYTIWGEPDTVWWQGTEDEYFKLYKYAVLGAKRADPNAKIGGPAVSDWKGVKGKSKTPLIQNFIKYASETELKELKLKRLPIDYINWHQFNADPLCTNSYGEPVKTIRGWLKKYGYNENTELLIGEWIIWQYFGKEHGFLNTEHDTEINASHIVSSLLAMDEAGITRHCYAYLIDSFPGKGKEFVGDFGLFTKHGITKANFNAFKALSMLDGQRIWVDNKDLTIRAVATKKDERIAILVSNFVPWGQMSKVSYGNMLKEKGFTKKDKERMGIDKKQIQNLLSGAKSVTSLNASKKQKDDIQEIISIAQGYEERRKNPVTLRLNILGAPDREYQYETYLIDSKHSNSYAIQEKLQQAYFSKGMSIKEINDLQGVRLEKVKTGIIKNIKHPDSIVLEPYAVQLIILTPK